MVELRKRPAPKETATPAPAAKRSASKPRATAKSTTASTKAKPKPTETKTKTTTTSNDNDDQPDSTFPLSPSSTNQTIALSTLNSEIKLNTDEATSISKLLESSEKGIIIFSYPKASTPGCTTQACLFRDSFEPLKKAGLNVYGLSADSPKSNTTFVTKQRLNYPLLCDPDGVVSGPLGLKKPNPAKGTVRGVVMLTKGEDDAHAVVQVYFLGGPQKTLDVVLEWVEKEGKSKL